uniref:Uncharacterized protein n=1 Tax=Anguilla anguilla TaxID=7936 RepID=A0A0E9WD11_ANGAN
MSSSVCGPVHLVSHPPAVQWNIWDCRLCQDEFGGMTLKSLPVMFYFLILHDVQIKIFLKKHF